MAGPTAPMHPRLVLLADAQEWSARFLSSILTPHGYQVAQVHTGPQLVEAARTRPADAILLAESLRDTDVPALVRGLRGDPLVPQETPVILLASGPVLRPRLVAALRAGMTDLWSLPMDAEELVLRLGALVRARLVVERMRDEALLDGATGLYNRRGLALRARDLASQADRRHGALACVVLAPALDDPRARRHKPAAALDVDAAVHVVADCLKRAGRSSDAIGRLAFTEFAVLAPDTDARGARQLSTRLGAAISLAGASGKRNRAVRAGYHGVSDFHTAGLGALDLIARATTALRAVQTSGAKAWIRSFD